MCYGCLAENLLPGNENKKTKTVYTEVACKLLMHLCSLSWLHACLHWTLAKSDKWELSWDKEGNLLNCSDVLKKKWYSGKGKKKVNLNNTWKVFTISEIKYWSAWSLFIQLIVSDRNIQQCASLTPNGGFKWVWVSCIDYTWNWIVTLLYFVWVIRILKVIMDSQW